MIYERNNVRVWASDLDPNALLQAERTARLPILAGPVALMADAHVGIGATVGSVVATEGTIIPAAVGVDIGCGMVSVATTLHVTDLKQVGNLDKLLQQFGRSIPAGLNRARDTESTGVTDKAILQRTQAWLESHPTPRPLSQKLRASAWANLGTLGSGNHFLEVSQDPNGMIWVVLHSGSRYIGNALANEHIKIAKDLAKKQGLKLEDPDLAYLTKDQDEFHAYIADMLWAQDYAWENREVMMAEALRCLFEHIGKGEAGSKVNCHHNFAIQEEHDGRTLWITRKGAIRADVTDSGIIPGSMGTATYLVRGLGNPLSYRSSAHGAGRRLSRGQAKRTLTIESLKERMGDRVWLSNHPEALLDEHPEAYKDIGAVMADQADLVAPVVQLTQIVNYKGA